MLKHETLKGHKRYVGLLVRRASLRAGEAFDMSSLLGALLVLMGISGGFVSALWNQPLVQNVLPVVSVLLVGTGVYLMSKEVWEVPQSKLDEQARRKPLEITGTAHEDRMKRLRVHNPNAFGIVDAYVAVHSYHQNTFPHNFDLKTPSTGTVFNWGTYQRSPGAIGAGDDLIVDIVYQVNEDHFVHPVPSAIPTKYDGEFPLTYGEYEIDIVLGSRTTVIPRSFYTLTIDFTDKDTFQLGLHELRTRGRREPVIPKPTVIDGRR